MMKFTTPATASEPYTAEAPPVRMSTRSIIAVGIWLMSGAAEAACTPPYGMRRPSISTRVRVEPRPRRFRVAVPVAPFDTVTFCAAKACGSWLTRSSMRVTPCVTTSAAVTCVTGVVDSRFADRDARARDDDFTQVFLRERRRRAGGRQRAHDERATYGRRDLVLTFHCYVPPAGTMAARLVA